MKKEGKILVSLEDLGMAYRKAKVDRFYIGNSSLLDILEYEENIEQNLKLLQKRLSEDPSEILSDKKFIGSWTLIPKSIASENNNNGLIHSDPQKAWKHLCSSDEGKPKAEFRLMAQCSMDFHVLSTLWLSKVGHKYDAKLNDCSYGNRLRRKDNGDLNPYSLGSFRPYLQPFRGWRDKGLNEMRSSLDKGTSIIAITADVSSFYHKLNPEFLRNDEFLTNIGLKLTEQERLLTDLFIDTLKQWAVLTPLKKGLPVGLPASATVANMALIELDKIIQQEMTPLYYGRYVDDILLVLENTSQFSTSEQVWKWIFARSKNLLKWVDENNAKAVQFEPKYHHDSKIEFLSDKNKVFILEGQSGITFVNSIAKQIHVGASEWRALPNLPINPEQVATDLTSANDSDGSTTDKLRKADLLSMKKAGFAIKLRDYEAYERDLHPDAWSGHRKSFLKAFIDHVLVLPTFFDLVAYLPRVIRLATSCSNFSELQQIIERLEQIVKEEVKSCGEIKINSLNEGTFDSEKIILRWKEQISRTIDENIKVAFPSRLSQTGKKLWTDNFSEKNEFFHFETDIKILQKYQQRLFNHDLAYMPFRSIALPKELTSQHGIPSKKTIPYIDVYQSLLKDNIYNGLVVLADAVKLSRKKTIPFGFVFATRPYSLTELYLLFKNPYSAETMEQLCNVILALRGFSTKNKLPHLTKDYLEVANSKQQQVYNIAVASWKTEIASWTASVTKNDDPDHNRYQRLNSLLNHIIASEISSSYLILPELSVPVRWFLRIALKLQGRGISLICGVEYLHSRGKVLHNQVWLALRHDGCGFPSMLIYRQDKQQPALHEEKELHSIAGISLKPQHPWKKPQIIRHGDFQFAILICSELTNIAYRTSLRGKVDALFVPEWNQDTETFNALVESAALDIHAYIIQCNDRQYGDSRIRAPYKESWRRDLVRIKGGKNDYFVIGEIDVLALRQFQSNFRSPDGPFKPVPDGFLKTMAHERKVLPSGNNS